MTPAEEPSPNLMPLPPLGWHVQLRHGLGRVVRRPFRDESRPLTWAVASGLVAWLRFPPGSLDDLTGEVLPMAVTVTAMLAGLMALAQSILIALLESPVMSFVEKEGYYGTLIDYQVASYRWQLRFIAAGLAVMILKAAGYQSQPYALAAPPALAFLGALAWFTTSRQMSLMFKLLRKKDG